MIFETKILIGRLLIGPKGVATNTRRNKSQVEDHFLKGMCGVSPRPSTHLFVCIQMVSLKVVPYPTHHGKCDRYYDRYTDRGGQEFDGLFGSKCSSGETIPKSLRSVVPANRRRLGLAVLQCFMDQLGGKISKERELVSTPFSCTS